MHATAWSGRLMPLRWRQRADLSVQEVQEANHVFSFFRCFSMCFMVLQVCTCSITFLNCACCTKLFCNLFRPHPYRIYPKRLRFELLLSRKHSEQFWVICWKLLSTRSWLIMTIYGLLRLFVVSPNGQQQCAGEYVMLPNQMANGQPVARSKWRKGGVPQQARTWKPIIFAQNTNIQVYIRMYTQHNITQEYIWLHMTFVIACATRCMR